MTTLRIDTDDDVIVIYKPLTVIGCGIVSSPDNRSSYMALNLSPAVSPPTTSLPLAE